MRRCYRGAALVLGGFLLSGIASTGLGSFGTLTVYAAEDAMTEEVETVLQEEVRTEEENVETNVPSAEETNVTWDEQEYQVLLKIVEAEAGGEDTTGKMLVANVVMNRVRSGSFPNSISEVVYQKNNGKAQFSPTVDGRINTVSVSADTMEAVARVMNGEDLSQGALFFRAAYSKNSWFDRALTRVVEHGNHIFYTL